MRLMEASKSAELDRELFAPGNSNLQSMWRY